MKYKTYQHYAGGEYDIDGHIRTDTNALGYDNDTVRLHSILPVPSMYNYFYFIYEIDA